MKRFHAFESGYILLDAQNIDTDQIVPARFLKRTHKEGIGDALFYDWRFDRNGQKKSQHILNLREDEDIRILVAGANFGCGSSREHAVWALAAYGFQVIISPSIGDIFKSNAVKNGLLPIEVSESFFQELRSDPESILRVDLDSRNVKILGGSSFSFSIDPFARLCLLRGMDQLDYLLEQNAVVSAFERRSIL